MNAEWFIRIETLGKIIAFKHLRNGVLRGEFDYIRKGHLGEPFGIVFNREIILRQNLRCLIEITLTIRARLLQCKSRSRFGFTSGIANHAGKITHNQNSMMSHILKLSHLAQYNSMTDMQIRTRWIASQFDDHGFIVL